MSKLELARQLKIEGQNHQNSKELYGFQEEKYQQSLIIYSELTESNPNDLLLKFEMTELLYSLGFFHHTRKIDLEKAKEYYLKASLYFYEARNKDVDSLYLNYSEFNNNELDLIFRIINNLAGIYYTSSDYLNALKYYKESYAILHTTNYIPQSIYTGKKECLFWLGETYKNLNDYTNSKDYYQQYLQHEIKFNPSGPERLGDIYQYLGQLDDAKKSFEEATILLKTNTHDTLLRAFIKRLDVITLLWRKELNSQYCDEYVAVLKEATDDSRYILEKFKNIPNNFPQDLTNLSYRYRLFPTNENTTAYELVETALIWSEMQLFLPKNLQENANEIELDDAQLLQKFESDFNAAKTNLNSFWQSWLDYALNYNDNSFILDVVGALHGMYLQRILKANELLDQNLEDNQIEFIKLKKQLAQGQLELRSGSRTEDEKKKLEENLAVQNLELQNLRKTLIEKGLYFDKDSLNDYKEKVFEKLEPNQAVVICINFADYGLDEKKHPQFLIVKKNEHKSLNFQWLNLNQLSKNISETPNDWGIVYNSMNRGKRLTADANAKLLSVKENMSAFWKSLKNTLGNEYNDVSFIAQGNLSGLPWQGLAPEGINVSYFSGLYAYKQRKTAASNKPFYPTVDSPLAVLFNDAKNDPENRLYHLPAEIEAIKQIWGVECVNELKNLSDSKGEHSLFVLLGHGDHLNGEAQFVTSTGEIITQYDFLNHPYPIRFLAASSCVLGVEKNISGEPLGLMSVCGVKQSMEFSAGALIPIDDLLSVVLTILFHCNWKAKRNPTTAMNEALSQMKSGKWIEEAQTVFVDVFTDYLPNMFCDMYNDENDFVEKRIDRILSDWGIGEDKDWNEIQATDTKQLVKNYLHDITTNPSSKNVETFCQCWAYG
jgi:hypothetical protein